MDDEKDLDEVLKMSTTTVCEKKSDSYKEEMTAISMVEKSYDEIASCFPRKPCFTP